MNDRELPRRTSDILMQTLIDQGAATQETLARAVDKLAEVAGDLKVTNANMAFMTKVQADQQVQINGHKDKIEEHEGKLQNAKGVMWAIGLLGGGGFLTGLTRFLHLGGGGH